MKAGVSEVEFHREDQASFGWRAPALLLINESNGSAVVEYGGRPYRIRMRSLRPSRGAYHIKDHQHENPEEAKKDEAKSWIAL